MAHGLSRYQIVHLANTNCFGNSTQPAFDLEVFFVFVENVKMGK